MSTKVLVTRADFQAWKELYNGTQESLKGSAGQVIIREDGLSYIFDYTEVVMLNGVPYYGYAAAQYTKDGLPTHFQIDTAPDGRHIKGSGSRSEEARSRAKDIQATLIG